ncbi:MAG: hypothetical protein H0T72_06525 [Chloroflexia bacterium]|nr:hypothetical protein [Chloroflexia bacterium]
MRTRISLVMSAVLLMLSVLSIVQPAAAAPAEPFQTAECFDFGGGYEYCYEAHGVFQENTSKSGNTKYTYNATSSYTFTLNGQDIQSGSEKYHSTFIAKDGESQVYHDRGRGSFSYVDFFTGEQVNCTYDYNWIYANGEVRHEINNVDCG